jgi:hypothetical protein
MFRKADLDHMLSRGTTYVRIFGGTVPNRACDDAKLPIFLKLPRNLAMSPSAPLRMRNELGRKLLQTKALGHVALCC